MNRQKSTKILIFGLAFLLLVGVCAYVLRTQAAPTETSGIANPASEYCELKGGKVDMRTLADGSQAGMCVFPDGSECDEWAFFRGTCAPESDPAKP